CALPILTPSFSLSLSLYFLSHSISLLHSIFSPSFNIFPLHSSFLLPLFFPFFTLLSFLLSFFPSSFLSSVLLPLFFPFFTLLSFFHSSFLLLLFFPFFFPSFTLLPFLLPFLTFAFHALVFPSGNAFSGGTVAQAVAPTIYGLERPRGTRVRIQPHFPSLSSSFPVYH